MDSHFPTLRGIRQSERAVAVTDEQTTESLRVRLAERLGWIKSDRELWTPPKQTDYRPDSPFLPALVAEAEGRLTDRYRQGQYELALCKRLHVYETWDSDDNYEGYPAGSFFKVATASPETRAAALLAL